MKDKDRHLAVVFALSVMQLAAAAKERRVDKSELPAAQNAMEQETARSGIRGHSGGVEDGQQECGVETVKNGHTRAISFAGDGRVLEEEGQVKLADLPPKVHEALEGRAGTAIIKIGSIS